jgi:uncharacterized damage-inducible protein DinB
VAQRDAVDTSRIADQMRRAFEGEAWHGSSVLEILEGVTAQSAAARPLPAAHSIWEIVLHIAVWDDAARRRMAGEVVQPTPEEDWPAVHDTGAAAWQQALDHVTRTHAALIRAVEAFSDARLLERVPGKHVAYYTFY